MNVLQVFSILGYTNKYCSTFYACLFVHPWIGLAPGATSIATPMWHALNPSFAVATHQQSTRELGYVVPQLSSQRSYSFWGPNL